VPWLAFSRCEYGALLLARDGPGDAARGTAFVEQASATAEALGMGALAARVQAVRRATAPTARQRSHDLTDIGLGDTARVGTLPPHDTAPSVFRDEGDYWAIGYAGRAIRLRGTRGLRYLAHLLWHPGREFHATELVRLAVGNEGNRRAPGAEVTAAGLGGAGETIDEQARREYGRHLSAAREQLAEAERNNDLERASRLRAEIDAVAHALAAAPRGQRVAAHAERARLTVTKSIKAALTRIQTLHPDLGRHLAATVHRGYTCIYTPDPRSPIDWGR